MSDQFLDRRARKGVCGEQSNCASRMLFKGLGWTARLSGLPACQTSTQTHPAIVKRAHRLRQHKRSCATPRVTDGGSQGSRQPPSTSSGSIHRLHSAYRLCLGPRNKIEARHGPSNLQVASAGTNAVDKSTRDALTSDPP